MNDLSLEEAVRERTEELRGTIIELRQDLADAEREVDRLTEQNKGLIACLKKDVKYKQAVELAKREHENNKLTEQNKLMREALEKIVQMPTGEDVAACIIEEVDALTATGDPK